MGKTIFNASEISMRLGIKKNKVRSFINGKNRHTHLCNKELEDLRNEIVESSIKIVDKIEEKIMSRKKEKSIFKWLVLFELDDGNIIQDSVIASTHQEAYDICRIKIVSCAKIKKTIIEKK